MGTLKWAEGDRWQALHQIYTYYQKQATNRIEWYQDKAIWDRRISKLLRGAAILALAVAALLPLLSKLLNLDASLPAVAVAIAAGFALFDTGFGFSASWMRDVVTWTKLTRELDRFHLDWHMQCASFAECEKVSGAEAQKALQTVIKFADRIDRLTETETKEWMGQLKAAMSLIDKSITAEPKPDRPDRQLWSPDEDEAGLGEGPALEWTVWRGAPRQINRKES